MFPIGDDNTGRKIVPIVTYALVALNVFVFFIEIQGGNPFIMKWSFVPSRFLENPAADVHTVFSSMFMHAGWLHLLGNMLYLWIFGDNVEDRLGHLKFLMFYLLCGIAAMGAQLVVSSDSSIPNLGASGAIAGVLGAYLVMFPRGAVRVLQYGQILHVPALIVIGIWFALQLFSGIGSVASAAERGGETGGVAYMAHIGGFVAGFVLTYLFRGNRRAPAMA